jgi:hypothetical protein
MLSLLRRRVGMDRDIIEARRLLTQEITALSRRW